METLMIAIQHSPPYAWMLLFFAAYPIVTSITWITTALLFRWRWEPAQDQPPAREGAWPFVSVMVPAHNEQAVIARSVRAMLRMDYPAFEVVVIDDGSRDGTLDALAPLMQDARLRIVHKPANEGKAMALNDAIPLLKGEILVGLDADAEPDAQLLRW